MRQLVIGRFSSDPALAGSCSFATTSVYTIAGDDSQLQYYKVSKIRLNGSHIISENGIYICS